MSEGFKIHVVSEDEVKTVEAAKALWKQRIPTIGPFFAGWIRETNSWTVADVEITAIVDADDERTAGLRVRQVVGRAPGVFASRPIGEPFDPAAEF